MAKDFERTIKSATALLYAPEDGKANDAVLRLLADSLKQPASAIELLRGSTGRDKIVRITPRDS